MRIGPVQGLLRLACSSPALGATRGGVRMRIARLVFVLLLCLSACTGNRNAPKRNTPEQDLEEGRSIVARWRADILAKYGDMSGEEVTYYGQENLLLGGGPRYLPAVIEAYRTEANEYLANALGRVICDRMFFATRMFVVPCLGSATEIKNKWEKELGPYLESKETNSLKAWEKRFNLLAWWDHRREFLDCTPLAHRVYQVVGRSPREFRALDDSVFPSLIGFCFSGIYTFPCFLDIISEDNNPYVFGEFLRMIWTWERDDTYTLDQWGTASHAWELDARFPTREAKLRFLCEWWRTVERDYEGLPELRDALEQRFKVVRGRNHSRVKDPIQGLLRMVEDDAYGNGLFLGKGERIETVLRIDADIDGDGRNEILLSPASFIDGRKRHIWHLYLQKDGEYEFLRACAFNADTLYVGPYKDQGVGTIWYDYEGDLYYPEFKILFWKLENDYFSMKQEDRFPTGEMLKKSAKGRWGDHPAPPAAEEAMRKQLFPDAHRVEVQEIAVTPAMREQMKAGKK